MSIVSIEIHGTEQLIVLDNITYISGPTKEDRDMGFGQQAGTHFVVHFVGGESLNVSFDSHSSANDAFEKLKGKIKNLTSK